MKSLADRRRLYIFLRILAGSTAAIIVWGIINLSGLISLCPADDPGCHLHDIVPVQLEHGWLGGGTSDVKAFESGFAIPDNDDDDDDDDDGGEIVVRKAANQNTFSGSVSSVVSQARDHGETTFLAHAPGFSVIQNAYWRNDTWYFVTSKPWSQPEVSLVVTNGPDHGQTTKTDDSVVQVLSLAEANAKGLALEKVHVVPGTSMFFNDRIYLDHYYHVVGEMFLGAWRTYTSILYDANEAVSDPSSTATPRSVMDRVPEIARLIFAHVSSDTLFDHAGLNKWFFETCFPKAEWEFERDWQRQAVGGKWYRFDNVIIADRRSGHMGGGVSKPMDLAFKLLVPERWLTDLKDRILANYAGSVSIVDPSHMLSRPVITYISRQTAAHRRLKGEIHEQLVAELQTLEQDRIAEVHIEEFTDADSKDEQVAKLSRTTILIGLHGNGLTNLIWMTPDPRGRSTVYEIQQKGLFIDDYAVLSEALGIKHWIIGGRTDSDYCERSTCGIRGNDPGILVGSKDYTFDAVELVNRIRQKLTTPVEEE